MEPNQPQPKKDSFLAISILAAAVIIGGSFVYGSGLRGGGAGQTAQVSGNGQSASTITPQADDDVILGDAAAPVTVIEFGDYQCPYCGAVFGVAEEVAAQLRSRDPNWEPFEPRLREEYIKTGKVKMVYRDFPLDSIHPYATPSAEAAECAREEGKYWLAHDYLFEHQSELAALASGKFADLARAIGVDQKIFASCVTKRAYKDEVRKDYADGVAAGITGTPTSFVNGKAISGAVSYGTLKAAIDEALAAVE